MAKTNQRGKNNNNPKGHNQYTNDWLAPAKDHPIATAAAAAAAVGAGLFLWSKRDKVGNQVTKISQTANEMASRAADKAGKLGHAASEKASDWIDEMQSRVSARDVVLTDASDKTARKTPRTTSRKAVPPVSAGSEPVSY